MHVSECRHCCKGTLEITARLTYRVSLSRLYREQIAHIKEVDTRLNYKKVAQNIKKTVMDLEKMQRAKIDIETTRIRSHVEGTPYIVVYKVQDSPNQKLIAKKIIKCR